MTDLVYNCISFRMKLVISSIIVFTSFFLMISVHARTLREKPIKTGIWRGTAIEYLGGNVVLQLKSGADSLAIDSLLQAHNCYIINYFGRDGWGLIGCDTIVNIFDMIDTLRNSPLVAWAEPNGITHPSSCPNDPYFVDSSQWFLWNTGWGYHLIDADMDALEAWEIETGDSNLIIAILDTGFPYDPSSNDYKCHPDLRDTTGKKFTLGYNFTDSTRGCVTCDSVPCTCWGKRHGTQVTGIVAAVTNNNTGIAGIVQSCHIYVIKLWPDAGYQDGMMWCMAEAIDSAVSYGSKIINISGGLPGLYSRLAASIYNAYLANCLIVAAAGSQDGAYMDFPAGFASYSDTAVLNCCPDYPYNDGFRNVISVACSDDQDRHVTDCARSIDSVKVTVVAADGAKTTWNTQNRWPCEGYATFNASSCATPHVTGEAGLLQSHAMSIGDTLTADSIRTLIENTADDLAPEGWDIYNGFGRINALRALMAMDGYYPNATGYLRTNATWGDTLGDTIYVLGDVVVPEGCTLSIDQGAVVKFLTNDREDFGEDSTKCEIIVQGKLIVNGTANDSVWFVSEAGDSATDSSWYGIRVDLNGSATLQIAI